MDKNNVSIRRNYKKTFVIVIHINFTDNCDISTRLVLYRLS